MIFREFKDKLEKPVFWSNQIEKLFPNENKHLINIQLSRWEQKGRIIRLKRGIYKLADSEVDELVAANLLYKPSYISLESALHILGLIPDVPSRVTSITTITSKKFQNSLGVFSYSKIKKNLYFGFQKVKDEKSQMYYQIAEPEKAFLDWLYIRNIKSLEDSRVDKLKLNKKKLALFSKVYPNKIKKVIKP